MNAWWTLFKRELSSLFLSPVAYVFAIATTFILGSSFALILQILMDARETNQQRIMQYFFGGNFPFWTYLIALATALTMRLFAEEKRSGTIETLLTAPVSDVQVVLAKYGGVLAFYLFLWLPTGLCFSFLGAKGLDLGNLASAYLGVGLVGGLFLAVGGLLSSLCTNQFVAAILSAITLMLLAFAPLMISAKALEHAFWRTLFGHMNLIALVGDFNRGLVTVAHLAYPVSLIACSLYLTVKVMGSRSWR